MADRAVSRRPRDIEAVINRGGTSSDSGEPAGEKERIFNLRVPESLVHQVDVLRKRRPGKISRNTWILEAMEEKLERDEVG
jgi:predicted HicB family RNase H-like nuclease